MVDTLAHSATLVDLLRHRAVQQPDQRAYTFLLEEEGEVQITYAELDRKARAIGAMLQSLGAEGSRALLLYPPGLEYIAAFFGCLYAGVNAVPAYPPRQNGNLGRLQAIASDAQAKFAFTTSAILSHVEGRFAETTDQPLKWLVTEDIPLTMADAWQPPRIDRSTLAFLQYTSGSTSLPKGVMLSHGNLLHNLQLIHESFAITADSNCVIWLPPYHDMGLIGGILQPFYGGYPVTLMSPVSFVQRPLRWLETISRIGATLSGGPNFAYELCTQKITPEQRATLDLSTWQTAFTGAEPIRAETLERFVEAFEPCGFRREAFYPCYGLAESTLFVTGGLKTEAPIIQTFDGEALKDNRVQVVEGGHEHARTLVGCGHARMEQQQVAIVDPQTLHQVAEGTVGEIWVAGPSIAHGYWNLAEKTAETFGAHIANTGEGPFLRTGDLGFLQDGELYVTGRLKDLIIIRGRNYYPQDIEYTMQTCHPALKPDFGAAFSVDVDGEERLVVVQEIDRQFRKANLDEVVSAVRQAVAEQHQLQVYAVVLIKPVSIPKTSSGKIQRHACRDRFLNGTLDVVKRDVLSGEGADAFGGTGEEATAPVTLEINRDELLQMAPQEREAALEAYLLAKAAQVLKLAPAQVDRDKPLSSYGLDSLMAVELKNAVEESVDVILPVVTFLEGPSLVQLTNEVADELDKSTVRAAAFEAATVHNGEFPASFGQRALWFMQRLAPSSSAYNIAHAVRLEMQEASLDADVLREAFARLTKRHPLLRATFHLQGEDVVVRVQEQAESAFVVHDATALDEAAVRERLTTEANTPFDLEKGPLLRVQLFTRSEREHLLQLTMHHIISDFWSLSVLVSELRALYVQLQQGEAPDVQVAEGYAEYAVAQRQMLAGAEGEAHLAYWQEQLGGALPVLNLPTDRPRPPVQTYNGASASFHLPKELSRQVKTVAKEQGVTLFTLLLAAYQALLHRYTGQEEVVVGSPTAGRSRAKQAELLGYFVNPVALRTKFGKGTTVAELLDQVKQTVFHALEHQEYPFPLLVEKLQPQRDPSYPPIFQTMFVLQKSHLLDDEGLSGLALQAEGAKVSGPLPMAAYPLEQQTAQFDLTLAVADVDGQLAGSFEYNTDLYDAATIERMAGHWEMLLAGLVADLTQPIAKLPLLTPDEWQRMYVEWNDTATPDTEHRKLWLHVFEAQVAKTPDNVAVVFEDRRLTYAELNRRANQLARHLQSLGIGKEKLVGISMERSLEMAVALIGIFKAGAAYLPLDPAYPSDRLAFMIEDSEAALLVVQPHLQERLQTHGVPMVTLDAEWETLAALPAENVDAGVELHDLASVIYTSGSTGKPKGVMVEHRGFANYANVFRKVQQLTEQSRLLQFASFSFDASLSDFLVTFTTGATLCMATRGALLPGENLYKLMRDLKITHVSLTPSVLSLMAKYEFPDLHTVTAGGEACTPEIVNQWTKKCRLLNGYGPTEGTIAASYPEMEYGRPPHIGRPISNYQVFVLDANLQPLPIGVPGELHIAGVGIARGYLKRPELTAEKFIPNPFSPELYPRLYKTGDLVRLLPDGNLEFLGRIDHQVKIRGFRIEIGEIESLLLQHESVRDAIVMAREDVPGNKRLVAYVVPNALTNAGANSGAQELRDYMKKIVPDYMVPTGFVFLDKFPLSPNNKVDLKALPAPDNTMRDVETEYVAPQNEREKLVTEVWQEVLQLDKVGIHDNFFDLGGHSLLVTVAHTKIQERLGLEFSVVEMFSYPTISSLVKFLSQQQPNTPSLEEFKDQADKKRDAINRRKQLLKDRRKFDE